MYFSVSPFFVVPEGEAAARMKTKRMGAGA